MSTTALIHVGDSSKSGHMKCMASDYSLKIVLMSNNVGTKKFWNPFSSEHGTVRAPPSGRNITISLSKTIWAVFSFKVRFQDKI